MMKARKNNIEKREERQFFFFISPWLLGFLIFTLYPMVFSVVLVFTNMDMTGSGQFIGFANIVRALAQDPLFYKSLLNTLYFVLVSVPVSLALAFLIALLLNQRIKGVGFFRTSFYIPYITSGVAVTLLWGWIFNAQFGLVNYSLSLFGISGPNWLSDMKWAMPAIIIMGIWTIGNSIIITLAGLQDIPAQLYESAEIDGASRLVQVTRITLPLVTPTLYFNLVMGIIGGFQIFMQPYILTEGGPNYATYTYMMHIYNSGFKYNEMGFASTLAWLLFIVIMLITQMINRTSKFWVYYDN
ncbi:carbohydrate ABC transporter permease [Paenibacillus puldeungensis]